MKKYLTTICLGFLIIACGGGGGDDTPEPTPTPVNKAPGTPGLIAPSNNLLCIDNLVQFSWNASTDPDGDAVSYEFEVATNNQFTQNVQRQTMSSTNTSMTLEKGVAYYWRIRAKDSKGAMSSYSPIYNFYTEGEGISNHLPFAPSLVSPEMNALVQTESVTLEWTASDVDTEDKLTFDIYFDTENPPSIKTSENQTELTKVEALQSGQTYFWRVVVKDDKGGEAIGPVWTFRTD